ncbi:hypothetical protein acdb102_19090 [Acidothermaceae bacterium B102]|nr:hypothetical protein acdb102_19090 [Acidothermaceae bacterium B102]
MNEFDHANSLGARREQPSSPLRSMARLWPVTFVLVALGLGAGLAYSAQRPVDYTAEARLAVGGQTVAAQAVPGFALASQQLAADFARYVTPDQDQAPLSQGLGARAAQVVSVSASPIPSSNVIRVEAVAHDPQTAADAAHVVAQSLLTQVNSTDTSGRAATLLTEYKALSDKVAAAQAKNTEAATSLTALENRLTPTATKASGPTVFDPSTLSASDTALYVAAQSAAAKASSALASVQIQQNAVGNKYQSLVGTDTPVTNLSFVQTGAISSDDKRSTQERFGLLGLLAGLVLALVVAALVDRRRARRSSKHGATTPSVSKESIPFGVVRVPPAPPGDREYELRATSGNSVQ